MICYHGVELAAPRIDLARVFSGRDAMVSFASPGALPIAAEVCRTVALDNGAFSAWRAGTPVTDWSDFYEWARHWSRHPGVVWACIPDVIDGNEADNDALLAEWPLPRFGMPVWHLHETLDRLERLAADYGRVALGSSGEYAVIGTAAWWARFRTVMDVICDDDGMPLVPFHGLRMLDPTLLAHIPFASADSTNVARNIGIDSRWRGTYTPASKAVRALVIMDRIDAHAKAHRWAGTTGNQLAFELLDCAQAAEGAA